MTAETPDSSENDTPGKPSQNVTPENDAPGNDTPGNAPSENDTPPENEASPAVPELPPHLASIAEALGPDV